MKFSSEKIAGLFQNNGDIVGETIRAIKPAERIVVSQGFGIPMETLGRFPLRFFSYIVPVIHLLRQLPETAIAELYFATNGVIRASDLPIGEQGINSLFTKVYVAGHDIKRYLREVHPEILNRVNILHDEAIHPGSPKEHFIDTLVETASNVANDKILVFTEKRGGKQAFRYMVEHFLYMRDQFRCLANLPPYLLVPEMKTEFDHLIMVGGPAEKIFYELRLSICKALNDGHPLLENNHQFFTPIGDPPTYHPQTGEPFWPLEGNDDIKKTLLPRYMAVTSEMGVRRAVLRDFLVLLNDAGGSNDFRWCGSAATALSKGKALELPMDTLQRGLSVIKSLCDYGELECSH